MKAERQDLKGYKYPTTRSKVIKIICRCTFDLRPLLSHYNKRIKTMNKEWITTAELIAYLKAHPDDEKECRLYLGHRLGSTHYWYWDAQKRTFMHTRDWPFSPISESEVKEWYGNSKWKIEQWTNVVSRHDTIVSRHKWPIRVKCTIQRYYSRSVLVRSSFGPRSVLVRFSFGSRSVLVRSSFGSRSVLVRSSFGPRSSFVHPSFGIRSGFVRDSKNNNRINEEATEMYLRHNGGIT